MLDIIFKLWTLLVGIAEGLTLLNYKLCLIFSHTLRFLVFKRRMANLTQLILATTMFFNQLENLKPVVLLLYVVLMLQYYILALIHILYWLFSSFWVALLCILMFIYHLRHLSMSFLMIRCWNLYLKLKLSCNYNFLNVVCVYYAVTSMHA